eukprot:scaffold15689_cov135-Isochrysis_galbana.AAC.5
MASAAPTTPPRYSAGLPPPWFISRVLSTSNGQPTREVMTPPTSAASVRARRDSPSPRTRWAGGGARGDSEAVDDRRPVHVRYRPAIEGPQPLLPPYGGERVPRGGVAWCEALHPQPSVRLQPHLGHVGGVGECGGAPTRHRPGHDAAPYRRLVGCSVGVEAVSDVRVRRKAQAAVGCLAELRGGQAVEEGGDALVAQDAHHHLHRREPRRPSHRQLTLQLHPDLDKVKRQAEGVRHDTRGAGAGQAREEAGGLLGRRRGRRHAQSAPGRGLMRHVAGGSACPAVAVGPRRAPRPAPKLASASAAARSPPGRSR